MAGGERDLAQRLVALPRKTMRIYAAMSETLQIGELVFEVRRSERRTTLGADRGPCRGVGGACPGWRLADDLDRWTRKKLLWVQRKLALKAAVAEKIRQPEFVSGESFCYLGRRYRLRVTAQQTEPFCFDGQGFSLRSDARAQADEHFKRWYVAVGTEWLEQRVKLLARKTGATPAGVEVRELGFRWGSCGRRGVLFFNWRLLQLPVRLADYVIVHELVHLQEPHHGPSSGSRWGARCRTGGKEGRTSEPGREFLRFGLGTLA